MDPARRLATYADLLARGDDDRAEIIAGTIHVLPAPRPRHSKVQRALGSFVGRPFDDDDGHGGPGGWWIFVEVDVQLSPHDVVRPDVSGWRRERLPQPDVRPICVTPDWACEIVSPSTAARDRVAKRRLYEKHGISFYWLIDPDARTLEALALGADGWREIGSFGEGDVARIAPFEAIELDVGRLFLPRSASPDPAGD